MSDEETVSKAEHLRRLKAKDAKLEELTAKLTEAQTALKAAPDIDSITRKLEKLQSKYDALSDQHESYKGEVSTREAMYQAGITDAEDMDLVRYRWSKIDEAKRPDLASYLESAAREDRYLKHIFDTASDSESTAEASQGTTQTQPAQRQAPPPANNGVQASPGLASPLSYDMIGKMTTKQRLEQKDEIAAFFASDS